MNNPDLALPQSTSDNFEVQRALLEIAINLAPFQDNSLESAKRIQEAIGSLDGKTIPFSIGEQLINIFKKLPEAYFFGTPDMSVFLRLGVTFIKDEEGNYTVHSAPQNKLENKPQERKVEPVQVPTVNTSTNESGMDIWEITDTRDTFEVPNMIANHITNETSYRFRHSSAPGQTFTWSESSLSAEPGDETSDAVLRGNLLNELRAKKVKGSITFSSGEKMEL